jgi:hypothetical protein
MSTGDLKTWNRGIRLIKFILFVLYILVPTAIILSGIIFPGFGILLAIYALFQVGITSIILFGDPEKWIPGHANKAEKKRKMEHYYYHCERNPEGFNRIFIENLKNDEEN